MKSYGKLIIQDGIYTQAEPDMNSKEKRGFARFSENYQTASLPTFVPSSTGIKTFSIDLYYNDYKYIYAGSGKNSYLTNLPIDYQKNIKRISGQNSISKLKKIVSEYTSCEEAHKLRKRAIALNRIHRTISNETFKFLIEK